MVGSKGCRVREAQRLGNVDVDLNYVDLVCKSRLHGTSLLIYLV